MAYDPHTLVTFGGTLQEKSGQDEIWQCGIRGVNIPGDGPVAATELQNLVTAIASQVSATQNLLGWFQAAASQHLSSTQLKWVKAVNIGADGKYTSDPAHYTYATPGVGGVSAQGAPTFLSVCYSWTTARTFGRKLRNGRIYPPNAGTDFTTGTSKITSAAQTGLVTQAQTLLSAVAQSGAQFAFKPAIVSAKGGHELITGVRVGDVYDVHRSRKDAVAETYVAHVWP